MVSTHPPRVTSAPPAQPSPHPDVVLGPATRLLWRSPDSVSLELDGRGVVLDGVTPPLVRQLVGSGSGSGSGSEAGRAGPPALNPQASGADVAAVLDDLREAGLLWRREPAEPVPADGPPLDPRRTPPTPVLAGELLSLAARRGEQAAPLLDARRHVSVVVTGAGRAAAHLASLLAAAGIGRVHCVGNGSVRLHHAMPGGLSPADEGRSIAAAAEDAVLRAAPTTDTGPPRRGERPDLVVLAVDGPVDETRRAALHAERSAHLLVTLGVAHGTVGPLVLPGLTSCLRCADLHRRDRDPHWPALAAQLSVPPRHGISSDVTIATLVVATASMQVLHFVDGDEPACLDGSLEWRLPDWRVRRRSRPVHPDCGCTGAAG